MSLLEDTEIKQSHICPLNPGDLFRAVFRQMTEDENSMSYPGAAGDDILLTRIVKDGKTYEVIVDIYNDSQEIRCQVIQEYDIPDQPKEVPIWVISFDFAVDHVGFC